MHQLYAMLIYCVGHCTSAYVPDGLVLYPDLKTCEAHNLGLHISDPKAAGFDLVEHCARIYVDPSVWCTYLPTIAPGPCPKVKP